MKSLQMEFVLDPTADTAWTHLYGLVALPPFLLVERFGQPLQSDGHKVSGEWTFRRGDQVFTLYDWKATSLYDPSLEDPNVFWERTEPTLLHVGSKHPATPEDAKEFVGFLVRELLAD